MRFNKKYNRGLLLLFILLLIISGISVRPNASKNNEIDENNLSMSQSEDNYEPNNDYTTAFYLSERIWLSSIDGPGVQADDDWYEIYVDPGEERLIVFLRFFHGEGDIDIELINGSNPSHIIASNTSVTDNEYLDINVPSGPYYLRVFYGNNGNHYDLLWDDLDPFMTDDYYEENDFDSQATPLPQASWLSSNTNGLGFQADDDWYEIYLNIGEEHLFAELFYNGDQGNIDIQVFNGSDWWWFDEIVDITFDRIGTYYLLVTGSNSGIIYDLRWIGDDWMEENDDYWNAAWVYPNYYSDLKIVGGDDDWFGTYLNIGETINVSIYFDNSQGNLQLELYDPSHSDNLRVGSYSDNNNEFILFTADYSGDWRIRVYHEFTDSEVFYDLDIWQYVGDDWMEENDDYWSAWWVDARHYSGLKIMEYDEDWFRTYLNFNDTIDVRIYFDNYQGDLQLELYDPNDSNNLRVGSYSSTNDESISFTADISGDWRIRVYRISGDSKNNVHYNLEVWINGKMGGDDSYEPNNNFDEAYDLRDDERRWLSKIHGLAVQGDDDWYMIDVTPGFQHLIVNLTFNPSQGNIQVDVYRLWGRHSLDWNPIVSNYSMTGENRAVINCFHIDPGIYMIQVRGDFTGLEYDLWWDDERTDNRPDDNYEENDDLMTAYDLSSHEHEDLWSINGLAIQNDTDWYKIQVDPGFEHLFVLVMYDYQEGAIGIEIYNWVSSKVISNFTTKDNEYISYDLPSNGTYYIRIFGDHSGNIYNLRWETREPYTEGMIPGYDIFILLGVVFGVVVVFTLKWKRSKKHL